MTGNLFHFRPTGMLTVGKGKPASFQGNVYALNSGRPDIWLHMNLQVAVKYAKCQKNKCAIRKHLMVGSFSIYFFIKNQQMKDCVLHIALASPHQQPVGSGELSTTAHFNFMEWMST